MELNKIIPKIINELISMEAEASVFKAQAAAMEQRCQKIREALQPVSTGRSKKKYGLSAEEVQKFLTARANTRIRRANKMAQQ